VGSKAWSESTKRWVVTALVVAGAALLLHGSVAGLVVVGLLALTALIALAGPALRAVRVDPLVALRDQ